MLSGVTSSVVVRVLYQIIIYMSSNENLSLQICIYIYVTYTTLCICGCQSGVSAEETFVFTCLPCCFLQDIAV